MAYRVFMRPPDRRPLRATLFLAGLAACALSGGACRGRTTEEAPPVPDIAFEASVKPPLMSANGCAWAAPRPGEEEPSVECTLVLLRDTKVLALTWVAHGEDGRELGRGGSGGLPWKVAGEERRTRLTFRRTAVGPVARIAVEPL